MPSATSLRIWESRGKPRPKMPLTSSTKFRFVKFTRPMERTQKEMAPERKYREPKACLGTVKLPTAIASSATKPDASRIKLRMLPPATKRIHRYAQVVSTKLSLYKVALLLTETNDGLA